VIASMTGFGRAEGECFGQRVSVEVRSVNHRHADIVIRLGREWLFAEEALRKIATNYVMRGRLEAFVTIGRIRELPPVVTIHQTAASQWAEAARQIADMVSGAEGLSTWQLLQMEGVVTISEPEVESEAVMQLLATVFDDAMQQLVLMRREEGDRLCQDLLSRLHSLMACVAQIDARAGLVPDEYKERLQRRLLSLNDNVMIDDARLLQEIALFADRSSIVEEIVRLRAHLESMEQTLAGGGCCGRKLDFLLQEMQRELNTIGAKASDLWIAKSVIVGKTIVEQIREQVQNVE